MTARQAETCERARSLISRSLDCELPELQRTLLGTHLRRCDACAAFARDVDAITAALRGAPLEQPVRAVTTPRRRRPVRLRVAIQAASIALVAVGVGSVVLPGGRIVDRGSEEALLTAQLAEEVVSDDSLRTFRDDAVRRGSIAVLPENSSDPIGEAKVALPAIPGS
jgi:predicted anti-sigma-YlaC factor YlaD